MGKEHVRNPTSDWTYVTFTLRGRILYKSTGIKFNTNFFWEKVAMVEKTLHLHIFYGSQTGCAESIAKVYFIYVYI